jgi:hypothetical protein
MWGPVIDTLIMCTLTALVLMVTDVWRSGEGDGVLLTTHAFEQALPGVGPYLLLAGVLCLSFSSMLGFSYYVVKCGCFLFGQKARLPVLGLLPSHNCSIRSGENGCDYQLPRYCLRADGDPHDPFEYAIGSPGERGSDEVFCGIEEEHLAHLPIWHREG